MDDSLNLTQRVADAGDVIDTEPCFELTADAVAYLATHSLAAASDEGV